MAINPYSYSEYISYNIERHEGIPKMNIRSVGTGVWRWAVGALALSLVEEPDHGMGCEHPRPFVV